ncbi:MAG TPA: hypothetical protein VFE78_37890, partial [Gemmataceae bacterium]|nr:hypothetical protein [Gemmataceae bacterium]
PALSRLPCILSCQRLRFTVQELSRSKRGGVGGRPRDPVASHGPEVTLRELGRQYRRWLASHYLTQLQRHADQVAASPEVWVPWNYRAALT